MLPLTLLLLPLTDPAVDLDTQQQQQRPGHTNGAAQTQPDGASAPELFDWFKAWHPLVAVSSLKRDAPNVQKLLNMSLVVWWDKTDGGIWRCFEDLCPHR